MAFTLLSGGAIQPSAHTHGGKMVRRAKATMRAQGALRYQCPLTNSYVLLTDDATLATLDRPGARVRCADCGEIHSLVRNEAPAVSTRYATRQPLTAHAAVTRGRDPTLPGIRNPDVSTAGGVNRERSSS